MRSAVIFSIVLLLSFILSCTNRKDSRSFTESLSDSSSILKSRRFSIHKNDSCTILTITDPWQGAKEIRNEYYLVERGQENSLKVHTSQIISVPVRKIICMSSTHLAMISALGEEESIYGLSGTNYIYDPKIRARADDGLIGEIGYDAGINSELILRISPDLIMMYGIGSESAGYVGKISELGIKVMYNADYLETDPLGKAEWIKVFGALYCKEELADSIYNSVECAYNEIKKIVNKTTEEKPDVILGLPYKDTWFISPGNSYISALISDAGGNYLWQETESSFSMPYSFETVYLKSLKADYWLNVGTVSSKGEIASFDPKLEKIPCYISGNIYNNTRRISPGGGNDYWESGALNPHIILKDIAAILHPGIFREYNLFYYKKIE
jgi:iron complex transport system substrate-binding protein